MFFPNVYHQGIGTFQQSQPLCSLINNGVVRCTCTAAGECQNQQLGDLSPQTCHGNTKGSGPPWTIKQVKPLYCTRAARRDTRVAAQLGGRAAVACVVGGGIYLIKMKPRTDHSCTAAALMFPPAKPLVGLLYTEAHPAQLVGLNARQHVSPRIIQTPHLTNPRARCESTEGSDKGAALLCLLASTHLEESCPMHQWRHRR